MPQVVKKEQGSSINQSERSIAKARELGLDEQEETFDAALTKVARQTSAKQPPRAGVNLTDE